MEHNWTFLKDGIDPSIVSSKLGKYGILVLNRPVMLNPGAFSTFWNNASWRITIDGGTDRWLTYMKNHNLTLPPPHQITGDFDSIKPETLEYFRRLDGVEVIETPDQDFTDFHKALVILLNSPPEKMDHFLAIMDHSGRLDQTFSNVNTLYDIGIPGYMLTSDSLTWILRPGNHRIHIPPCLRNLEKPEWCAILPFIPATVSSTGLKWNLINRKVEFGGLISSSNTYDGSPEVTLTNDKPVIWSMSLGELPCS